MSESSESPEHRQERSQPSQISNSGQEIPVDQRPKGPPLCREMSQDSSSDSGSDSDDPDFGGRGAPKRQATRLLKSIKKKSKSAIPRSPRVALRQKSAVDHNLRAEASTQRAIRMEEEQAGSAQQVQPTSPQLEEVDYEEGEEHDQSTVSFTSPKLDSATEHLVRLAKAAGRVKADQDQRVKRLLDRINNITDELDHRRQQLKELLEGEEETTPRATSSSSASLPSLATPTGHVASTSSQPTPSVSHETIAVNLVTHQPKILRKENLHTEGILAVYRSCDAMSASNVAFNFTSIIDAEIHRILDVKIRNWRELDLRTFFDKLLQQYKPPALAPTSTLAEQIRTWPNSVFYVDPWNLNCLDSLFYKIEGLLRANGHLTAMPQQVQGTYRCVE